MKKIIILGLLISFKTWAGCNSPNSIMVTVDITAPTANQKIVMTSVNSTFTTLTAATSGDDDNALTWTFSGFVFPSGNTRASVTANTPANWPGDNSFWGKKTVKLEYNGGTEESVGDCKNSVDIKAFFPPTQDINGKPAWYVYWKGGVIAGLSELSYDPNLALKGETSTVSGSMKIGSSAFFNNLTLSVATVVIHEKKHQELINQFRDAWGAIFDAFWFQWGSNDGSEEWAVAHALCTEELAALDTDNDYVLDSAESGLGTTAGVYMSHPYSPDDCGDNGWLAMQEHNNANSLITTSVDWATTTDNPNWSQ